MIVLIHGDNVLESHKKLHELVQGKINIIHVYGETQKFEEIEQIFLAKDLFISEKIITLHNVSKVKGKGITTLLESVANDKNTHVYIIEESLLSKAAVNKIPYAEVHVFAEPKYYFQLLDGLVPHNASYTLNNMHALEADFSAEQIFYSLLKRVRILLMVKTGKFFTFEETKRMAPWQVTKLKSQAAKWNDSELLRLYKELFDTEVKIKTSNMLLPLKKHLDIVVVSCLK